ncbi:ATP-grasp domain-containing protein [Rhodobacteraceae bacterium 63075]|nr:ATP-grasp domain-containing protein [Rhodobacteraceae bacterium 63075]
MTEFFYAPTPMRSVLIANRGEIACRIIKTCRRLGLRSIAVYSEADAGARHVRLADTAHAIGPANPSQSYLRIDAIIAAAEATGADAVHPGYGFLSENADFVQAVADAGLVFVGPSADAVRRMGSKITAREIAKDAGVPVVPGYDAEGASDADFAKAAQKIGYPVLVKASAGGGGRGMRQAGSKADLNRALEDARKEAGAAFGDATVFIEKLIQSPRHIEVQVFGDGAGGALHFHDRDCSVQHNHQKMIEEAPAPNLPDKVRAALSEHATSLASSIGYSGVGTVEFVMGANDAAPYFLEMNTRLQVEHPVTEAICGVDLVEWQLRQAAGLPLPLTQDQITPQGHAIEMRINAERPEAGFLPDVGRIAVLQTLDCLRFDSGIDAGDTVSSHYDSMLAKLIAHGSDRDAARQALLAGIDGTALIGVGTNLGLLRDCLSAPAFAKGLATTAFLSETFPDGWYPDADILLRLRGQAALAAITGQSDPHTRTDGFRVGARAAPGRAPLHISDDYGQTDLCLHLGPDPTVTSGERDLPLGPPPAYLALSGPEAHVASRGLALKLSARALAEARMDARNDVAEQGSIPAPLTGLVTEVRVCLGDRVAKGDTLVVMEAMKLVHTLAAPFDGTVGKLTAAVGDTVAAKSILVEIEEQS